LPKSDSLGGWRWGKRRDVSEATNCGFHSPVVARGAGNPKDSFFWEPQKGTLKMTFQVLELRFPITYNASQRYAHFSSSCIQKIKRNR
jgi:hypothetical protein